MGGRGGSSGLRNGGKGNSSSDIWDKKKIDGYDIDGEYVKTPSGRTVRVQDYRELSPAEKKKYESGIKKAGIQEPVMINFDVKFDTPRIMPKKVADIAISQGKIRKEAFNKNVPGLNELRAAILYDEEQVRSFRNSDIAEAE